MRGLGVTVLLPRLYGRPPGLMLPEAVGCHPAHPSVTLRAGLAAGTDKGTCDPAASPCWGPAGFLHGVRWWQSLCPSCSFTFAKT